MSWKYANEKNEVAVKTLPNGKTISMLASQITLGEDEQILPADAIPDVTLKENTRDEAERYIMQFFSAFQLIRLLMLFQTAIGNQKEKITAVLTWLLMIEKEGLKNFKEPNFEQFGKPPFSYPELVEEK